MLWGAVAFAGGLFAGNCCVRLPAVWILAAFVCAISGIHFLRRRVPAAFAMALCLLFVGGALLIQLHTGADSTKTDLAQFTAGSDVVVIGHVKKEGTVQEKDFGEDVQKIDVETEQIVAAGVSSQTRAGLRITIFSKSKSENNEGLA